MKRFHKKSLVLLIAVALLLTCTVSGTVAFLAVDSGPVTNTFTPVKLDTLIDEDVSKGAKSRIEIVNKTGDEYIPVYVRVALAGNWVKVDGERTVIVRAATAEEMAFTLGDKWELMGDGFYYYKDEVAAGGRTSDLLGTSIQAADQTDGSYLVVTVVHQAIQTEPAAALTAAKWAWTPPASAE